MVGYESKKLMDDVSEPDKSGSSYLPSAAKEPSESEKLAQFLKAIEERKIAEFEHWSLYLDRKQYYVGRVFLWAKRSEAQCSFDLNKEEWDELFEIKKLIKEMFAQSFKPDLVNEAWLGNEMNHCHGHFVPRYKKPREFAGRTFTDKNWGHNYSRDNTKDTEILPSTLYTELCDTLKDALTSARIRLKKRN